MNTSSASITVPLPPTVTKVFGATGLPVNMSLVPSLGSTNLTFTITNPNTGTPLTGVSLMDTFPVGLEVANPSSATNTCGGTLYGTSGGATAVSLLGGTIPAGATCMITVTVVGIAAGTLTNSVVVAANESGSPKNTASASITVLTPLPPTVTKVFGATSLPVNMSLVPSLGSTNLTFTITNPNTGTPLTGVSLMDTFPVGLEVANPSSATNTCGGTLYGTSGGATAVSLLGGTIPAGATCTITVTVVGIAAGTLTNSVVVAANESGSAMNTASASITVAVTIPTINEPITVNDQVTITPLINFAGPAASFSDSSLGFNNVAPSSQNLTVSNVGNAPLMFIGSYSISSGFSVGPILCSDGSTSMPSSLAIGGQCTFTISYAGTVPTGTITFTDNAALSSPASTPSGANYAQTIQLNGTASSSAAIGPPSATVTIPTINEPITVNDQVTATSLINFAGPAAAFSDSSLGFNSTAPSSQNLTVSNVGNAPLVFIGSYSISSGFSVGPILCSDGSTSMPSSLAIGGQCTFAISYAGTASTGTITFTDNAALSSPASTPSGSNYAQTIQLNGTASTSVVAGPPSATVTIPTINEPITVTDTPGIFNTSSGANVTVTPVDTTTGTSPVTLTFSNVTQPGVTSLTTSPAGPPAPSGFQLGNPGAYYNISTTATYTGSVMICINYTGITFTRPPQLFHYQNGAWVNVTTSVNSTTMIVCGTTTSFSPFALFQPSAFPTTTAISAAGVTYGTPASVTVSVNSAGGTVTGSVSLSLDGGAASTLALSSGTAVFTLGVLNASTHTLSASFAAQGNFLASSASGTISVAQAPLKIAANNATRVYGGANPTLTASYAGFLNGDTPSVLIGTLSCITAATSASPVGTYPITCSGQTAANYSITYLPGQLTVTRALLTITANNLTKNFDAPNPTLTWTASGFVNGDSMSVLTTLPTCTTTAITTSPVGSYPITCSGAAAANYTFTYVPGTLTVTCHYVSIGLSPSTVAEGSSITVSWTLRSCANTTQTVAFTFTLSGPAQPDGCSPTKTEMFSLPPFALKPNTLESLSFPFKIPMGICAGTYTTTATTTINGQVVDTSSSSLTITAH